MRAFRCQERARAASVEAVVRVGHLCALLGLALVSMSSTRVAEACTPVRLHAKLLSPSGYDPIPTHAVLWFEVAGFGAAGGELDLEVELLGPNDVSVPVSFSNAAPRTTQYGPASSSRTLRAQVQLEPNTRYTLSFNSAPPATQDGEPERTSRVLQTDSGDPLPPPPSPTAELGFWALGGGDPLPFPCAAGEFDEATVVFAYPERTTALHLRSRYADEREFSRPLTHVLRPGAAWESLFLWAIDRGVPCVELVAEGADGARSKPAVYCEPLGCGEGLDEYEGLALGPDWWRRELGPGSCGGVRGASETEGEGCACVAVSAEAGGAGFGVGAWVVLVGWWRRRKRRLAPRACKTL